MGVKGEPDHAPYLIKAPFTIELKEGPPTIKKGSEAEADFLSSLVESLSTVDFEFVLGVTSVDDLEEVVKSISD